MLVRKLRSIHSYVQHFIASVTNDFLFIFSAKLDGVKTYMRMRRVPNHLQVKVIKWFDYLWLTQKCSDEEKAVSCLPDKLKVTVVILNSSTVSINPKYFFFICSCFIAESFCVP